MEREGGDPIAPASSHEISTTNNSRSQMNTFMSPPLRLSTVSVNRNTSSLTPNRYPESLAALTALHQSSRLSRQDSPQEVTISIDTLSAFLPPPPLFRPSALNNVIHRPQISALHAETLYGDEDRRYPYEIPPVPTLSAGSSGSAGESPLPILGFIEQLSSLQVRPRNRPAVLDSCGGEVKESDTEDPPKKKSKIMAGVSSEPKENYFATPNTLKSRMSASSFDIIGCPLSRVSAISDEFFMSPIYNRDVNTAIKSHLEITRDRAQQNGGMNSKVSEGDGQMHQHDQKQTQPRGFKKDDPMEKEKRILRRKIERLLLIRHCSICSFPLPLHVEIPCPMESSPTDQRNSLDFDRNDIPYVAELTQLPQMCPKADCAEGKVLCAHIRTCKLERCIYPRCLTSREVLGHYKKCRDLSCEICGPTRALDRTYDKHRNGESSIDTIEDWLSKNDEE
ncbi:hypothetical protein ACHAW5_009841 [Stephanodiscus triporus]|uniref:histone acetyltransferase n=1 Tax=Stephanodiscus triporus TaxID=2934178 RepID=A0ABD3NH63_9STRA